MGTETISIIQYFIDYARLKNYTTVVKFFFEIIKNKSIKFEFDLFIRDSFIKRF